MAAQRLDVITPFHVMALLARARQLEAEGRSIVHMEIGEPDFVSPDPIIEAGIKALQDGRRTIHRRSDFRNCAQQSPSTTGTASVFMSIPADYRYPGASGALQLIVAALVDPGNEVLLADPGYPCNRNFVHLYNGVPVTVPVGAADDYQLNAGLLERYWTAKSVAAMLASPSNPTGTLLQRDGLTSLLAAVRQRKGTLIVDEIYQNLCYQYQPGQRWNWAMTCSCSTVFRNTLA